MALPSENRLKKKSLISLVSKKGVSWKTPFFRALFLPAKNKNFQAVVVVSKKYDKRAVVRNSIRRKITGIFQRKKIDAPVLLVVFPYDGAKNAPGEQLEKYIVQMCEKFQKKNFSFSRKNNLSKTFLSKNQPPRRK